MIEYLLEVEKILPNLLRSLALNGTSNTFVNSKLVLYEKPMVERLWMQDGDNRIYLHCIHPVAVTMGEKAFVHTHPWPSAVKILSGEYDMLFGQENGPLSRMRMTKGSVYEMTDPSLIHNVSPVDKPILSLMVSGRPYLDFMAPKPEDKEKNPPLSIIRQVELLNMFRKIYS